MEYINKYIGIHVLQFNSNENRVNLIMSILNQLTTKHVNSNNHIEVTVDEVNSCYKVHSAVDKYNKDDLIQNTITPYVVKWEEMPYILQGQKDCKYGIEHKKVLSDPQNQRNLAEEIVTLIIDCIDINKKEPLYIIGIKETDTVLAQATAYILDSKKRLKVYLLEGFSAMTGIKHDMKARGNPAPIPQLNEYNHNLKDAEYILVDFSSITGRTHLGFCEKCQMHKIKISHIFLLYINKARTESLKSMFDPIGINLHWCKSLGDDDLEVMYRRKVDGDVSE